MVNTGSRNLKIAAGESGASLENLPN